MEIFFFIVILIAVITGFWVIVQTLKRQSENKTGDQSLLLLQNQIQDQQNQMQNNMNELTRMLDMKIGGNEKAIRDQFGESMKIVKEVHQELAKVTESNKQVISITDELKNLQDLLKNPKQRGGLGEYQLEMVLKNVFAPGQYKIQYPFKDSTIVDAVVFTPAGIVPIDSKFSLENYNRILAANDKSERERCETAFYNDLKSRIDETAKYVKPEEGTLDFAFMFIPSEAIYYDLLMRKVGVHGETDLIEYAGKKKVIIVSPTTFFAYLQTVLYGLKALHITEAAEKIKERVSSLGRHLQSYEDFRDKLGKNLGATVSAYNAGGKEFKKINKDIYRITDEELSLDAPILDKPEEDDGEEKLLF